jgi:hypothetical protein
MARLFFDHAPDDPTEGDILIDTHCRISEHRACVLFDGVWIWTDASDLVEKQKLPARCGPVENGKPESG